MPIIDPSPTAAELKSLSNLFSRVESSIEKYLNSPDGKKDPDFIPLTSAAISLNNASDTIAVMQLQLATAQGVQAVGVINKATAELQKALVLRNDITHVLNVVKDIVAFGGAIASDDVGSIISSGKSLYNALTAKSSSSP